MALTLAGIALALSACGGSDGSLVQAVGTDGALSALEEAAARKKPRGWSQDGSLTLSSTSSTATTASTATTTVDASDSTTSSDTTVAATSTTVASTSTMAPSTESPSAPIPTVSSLGAETPFSQMGGNAQVVGMYPTFKSMSEPGVYGSGTVLGNALRFGKVSDPKGSGRKVFRHALKMPDDATTACCHRVDVMPPNNGIAKEAVYWIAFDMLLPSNTYFANDSTTLANVHTGNGGPNGNWYLEVSRGRLNAVKVGQSGNTYWRLDGAGALADRWVKVVVKFRLSTGNSGMIQVWVNGQQMVNDSGPNSPSIGGDYAKMAFYNYSFINGFGDSSRPEREMFYGSYHIVKDAGYSLEQVSALLD